MKALFCLPTWLLSPQAATAVTMMTFSKEFHSKALKTVSFCLILTTKALKTLTKPPRF